MVRKIILQTEDGKCYLRKAEIQSITKIQAEFTEHRIEGFKPTSVRIPHISINAQWRTQGDCREKFMGDARPGPPCCRTPTPCTAEDIRFTIKGDALYAFVGAWPASRTAVIDSLGNNALHLAGRKAIEVSLLGYDGKLDWSQAAYSLTIKLPEKAPSEFAVTFRIKGLTTV